MSNKGLIERIAVKVKPEKRYTIDDITIRYDNEDKRMCIFLLKEITKTESRYLVTYEYKEEGIDNGIIISYTETSVPCHGVYRYYSEDGERYRHRYVNDVVIMQLFGKSFKDKSFTLEQLKDLEERINKLSKSAYYGKVYTLRLSDSYMGKAKELLDGMHIARHANELITELISLEREYLEIKKDDDENLIISFIGQKEDKGTTIEMIPDELWNLEEFPAKEIDNFDYFPSTEHYGRLPGFSRTALRSIINEYRDRDRDVDGDK